MSEILTKPQLKEKLIQSINAFNQLVDSLDKEAFELSPNGKWSAGQDLKHVKNANRIFGVVFSMPLFLLNLVYGKANRPSKHLEVFKQKYADKSKMGGIKAPPYLVPKKVFFNEKVALMVAHQRSGEYLIKRLDGFSEAELDQNIMVHPLFGKVTIREMFMSIFIHIDHHYQLTVHKLNIKV